MGTFGDRKGANRAYPGMISENIRAAQTMEVLILFTLGYDASRCLAAKSCIKRAGTIKTRDAHTPSCALCLSIQIDRTACHLYEE